MIESQENLKKNFKAKWNLKAIDCTTIARLLSELEGAYYILDVVDEHDADIIDKLRQKYYKKYFELKRST